MFVTLPLVAVGRELFSFFRGRIGLESWAGAPIPVEVPVEVHPPDSPPPASAPDAG